MSLELVGFENLPNAFIEEIELVDYDKTKVSLNFSVNVHDLAEGSIWSDTEEIFNQMIKVGFILSTDPVEIDHLISGNLNPLKANGLHTKNIGKHSFVKESKVYKFNFHKLLPSNTQKVFAFAFCFIDRKQILEKLKINVSEDYIGPLKCEKIVDNNLLNTTSNVFLRENGEYWAGPVHQHEDGFMIGSYHANTRHESLQKLEVPNTKIKDLRSFTASSISKKQKNSKYISDIFLSKNSKVDINSLFMINFKSFLKDKSFYGNFLNAAQSSVVDSLVDNFAIKSFSVVRQKIKRDRLKAKKIYSQKNIIRSYDVNQSLQKISRFEDKGDHDIIIENLRQESDLDLIVNKNEIFLEHLVNFKKVASIKEIFLEYGTGIRTFQLNDYEMSYNTGGEYQYKIELIMSDPTRNFLIETVNSISELKSNVKSMISLFKTGRAENSAVSVSSIINNYIKFNSYIYEIGASQKEQLVFKLTNALDFNTTNLQSLNLVLKMVQDLHAEMLRFLKYDSNLKDKNKKISIMSKESTINTIFLNHQFNKSFTPSDSEVSLSYLQDSRDDFVKVMTVEQVEERASQEVEKNFRTQPKFSTPIVPEGVVSGLSDITLFRHSYLSPLTLQDKDRVIDLLNVYDVPFAEFNKSVNKSIRSNLGKDISSLKNDIFSIKKPPASTEEFTEDDGESLVESSKTLGEDSEFVRYSDVLEDYNVIDDPTSSKESFDNAVMSINSERSVAETFANIKKLDPASAVALPVQIKSIINTFNDSTTINYINTNKDALSKPETKNFFELNNFSVQQVMVLKGFVLNKNFDLSMDKPIFATLTKQEVDSLQKPMVCILKRYTNNKFKISDSVDLSVANSLFIISDRDIDQKMETEIAQDPIFNIESFSYQFLNSVVVSQSNQSVSYSAPSVQTSVGSVVSTPNTTSTGNY